MNVDFLIRRQAISEWRDRQLCAVIELLNGAGTAARSDLDQKLDGVDLKQAVFDAESYVKDHIDAAMRGRVNAALLPFVTSASDELSALDSRLRPLGEALKSSVLSTKLLIPDEPSEASEPLEGPQMPAEQSRLASFTSRVAGAAKFVGELSAAKTVKEWGGEAVSGAANIAESISKALQDRTGLHDRMRRLGAERIDTVWMGKLGASDSFQSQVFHLINDVANEARSSAL